MRRKERTFIVSGHGHPANVEAKTRSAAVYRFRRAYGLLAGGGFKNISVELFPWGHLRYINEQLNDWVFSPRSNRDFRTSCYGEATDPLS